MTEAEIGQMLASHNKVQLATNGHDGFPHLVTMYYVMMDGLITFWTYPPLPEGLSIWNATLGSPAWSKSDSNIST